MGIKALTCDNEDITNCITIYHTQTLLYTLIECIVLKDDPRIMTSELHWSEDKFHLLSWVGTTGATM